MAYTPDVPQGNQTIASTTDLIRNNFEFLQAQQQQEHVFNGDPPNLPGAINGIHLRASMPNQADPITLPTGSNGMYYVSGGQPKFYNGAPSIISTGTIRSGPRSGIIPISNSFVNMFTPADNSCGTYFIYKLTDLSCYGMGSYLCNNAQMVIHQFIDPDMELQTVGKTLQARVQLNKAGNYILIYTENVP